MNGFHSFSFAFQFSSFQGAAGTKYRMSAFGNVEIMPSAVLSHSPSSLLTSVPFHFFSEPGQCPCVNLRAYSVTLRAFNSAIFFISSFCPFTVIVHWHEDDPSFELLWFTLWFSHHILNLVDIYQCSESFENFPLELHRLPVEPHALTGSSLIPSQT